MKCPILDVKRACFIGRMNSIIPGFKNLATEDQFNESSVVSNPIIAGLLFFHFYEIRI